MQGVASVSIGESDRELCIGKENQIRTFPRCSTQLSRSCIQRAFGCVFVGKVRELDDVIRWFSRLIVGQFAVTGKRTGMSFITF